MFMMIKGTDEDGEFYSLIVNHCHIHVSLLLTD